MRHGTKHVARDVARDVARLSTSFGHLQLRDHVELDPVEKGVIVDHTGVSRSATQRLQINVAALPQIRLVDGGERNQLDPVDFDPS
jgi:hypothetical protein